MSLLPSDNLIDKKIKELPHEEYFPAIGYQWQTSNGYYKTHKNLGFRPLKYPPFGRGQIGRGKDNYLSHTKGKRVSLYECLMRQKRK